MSIMLPFTKLFRYLPKRNCMLRNKYCTKISDKPLGNKFFHPNIQSCMRNLITIDYDYIYRRRPNLQFLPFPRYELMTDSELERMRTHAIVRAQRLLQLPPIIDVTSDEVEILSEDSSLDGHDKHHSKITFTDLSFGFNQYERLIVVREPDGILRTANKEERLRMELMFFPQKCRESEVPKMFESEHLKDVLDRRHYEFILDRACVQFEPDDEAFHKVLMVTYNVVNERNDFHLLEKTRHMGSMAFYLAIRKDINKLLEFFLIKGEVIKCGYLIKLKEYAGKNLSDLKAMDVESDELTFASAYDMVMDYILDPKNNLMQLEAHLKHLNAERSNKDVLKSHGIEVEEDFEKRDLRYLKDAGDEESFEKREDLRHLEAEEDEKNSKDDI